MNMIKNRKAAAGQGGFTLVELLVVIAILAVLAGAAIIGIGAMRQNAKDQVCKTDQKTLETAGEAYLIGGGTATAGAIDQADLVASGLIKTSISGITLATSGTNSAVVASGCAA